MRKLAVKKLKSSDLSFFAPYFRQHQSPSKQKGFNLDVKVMESATFYPSLKARLAPLHKQAAHVDLTISGPGKADMHVLARKIKIDAKNLRLNGELVEAPLETPDRYLNLQPGDFALFEFFGDPLPVAVKVVLAAAAEVPDQGLHRELENLLPGRNASMCEVSELQLEAILAAAAPPADHPIREWLVEIEMEQIGDGNGQVLERINRQRPKRGLSQTELKASKEAAERIGLQGEVLLDHFLIHQAGELADTLASHVWVAQENAISPFDFQLKLTDGSERHVDAKSTSGGFSGTIFLSIGEARHALDSGVPYDLYRLFYVTETSAQMRIARDIAAKLRPVVSLLDGLPPGVSVDKLSFAPDFFAFGDAVFGIAIPDEED
ncbi:MAG: hypothetical protein RLZZ352_208 [Pseudomonadota bacterium]